MQSAKPPTNSFFKGLRAARKLRGLSQEDFSLVSSRTYISSLERGLKSPTLSKVDELAEVLKLHPLTVLYLSYLEDHSLEALQDMHSLVASEIQSLSK